jgi:hypothetical protein
VSTAETQLAQALDQAFAAYKRLVGRPEAVARLEFMLQRDAEAQRFMDDAMARMGSSNSRGSE